VVSARGDLWLEGLDGAAGVGADVDERISWAPSSRRSPTATGRKRRVRRRVIAMDATVGNAGTARRRSGCRRSSQSIAVGLDAHGLILEHADGSRRTVTSDGSCIFADLVCPTQRGNGSVRPMAFPRKLLIPGEQRVLELRPHPVALGLAALATVGALILAGWLSIKVSDDGAVQGIIWIALIVFLVVYPVRKLVWWLTSDFVVTSSRVIHREGFIAKRSMEIPLDKINDVRFEQGIFERMVGAGTLVIQSASDPDATIGFIRHQKRCSGRSSRNEADGRAPSAGHATAVRDPGTPRPHRTRRLADLRARVCSPRSSSAEAGSGPALSSG
jgi:membrane protein YdbS with pleckstrin-like domain